MSTYTVTCSECGAKIKVTLREAAEITEEAIRGEAYVCSDCSE